MACQKLPHRSSHILHVRLQSKVARIQQLHLCIGIIALERLRTRGTKTDRTCPRSPEAEASTCESTPGTSDTASRYSHNPETGRVGYPCFRRAIIAASSVYPSGAIAPDAAHRTCTARESFRTQRLVHNLAMLRRRSRQYCWIAPTHLPTLFVRIPFCEQSPSPLRMRHRKTKPRRCAIVEHIQRITLQPERLRKCLHRLARLSKLYVYPRSAGTSVNPNPGRSGAITRYRSANRGISSRYWNELAGNPCSNKTTGASAGPASR